MILVARGFFGVKGFHSFGTVPICRGGLGGVPVPPLLIIVIFVGLRTVEKGTEDGGLQGVLSRHQRDTGG